MIRVLFSIICCWTPLVLSAQSTPGWLSKKDLDPTLQQMLALHVETKKLSGLTLQRAIKIYLEQFDPEKIYLRESEVDSFLNLGPKELESIAENFPEQGWDLFSRVNQIFSQAIERAQAVRQACLNDPSFVEALSTDIQYKHYVNFARSAKEQQSRYLHYIKIACAVEMIEAPFPVQDTARKKMVMELVNRRLGRIEGDYLRDPDDQMVMEDHYFVMHLLKALSRSLDAHSCYFSPEEAFELRMALEKEFEGIGVLLKETVDGVVVTDVIPGSPAGQSHQILKGDIIVAIDGRSLSGISYEQAMELLQANGQSQVTIQILHPFQGNTEEVSLKKERIAIDNEKVSARAVPQADGNIGVITLPGFYESGHASSDKDLLKAIRDLRHKGSLKGIVLDMRENSGGFLTQAVRVAGLFMTSGVVVVSKYSDGQVEYLRDLDGKVYFQGPLVLLTSKASASAAEIVAQALQDYGIALVVGDERTYGKGTVQYQTVTDPDATAFFKVTIGRYYTPSGKSTQINGVEANMIVPTHYAPFRIGERYLEYPLKADRMPAVYKDSLGDVAIEDRAWFHKYYLPYLQMKESQWIDMLPQLKQASIRRMEKDPDFHAFFKCVKENQLHISSRGEVVYDDPRLQGKDIQMQEAIAIVQDMIRLQTQKNAVQSP